MENENLILISNHKNWVEQAAKDQLAGVSRLPGVVKTVGLPDLHPGKTPVGMAVLSQGLFYPHLIGNDIGCGMSLFSTGVRRARFKVERCVTRLNSIRELSDVPSGNPYEEDCPIRDFGTIGSGNHFAEFQCLENAPDPEMAQALGLMDGQVFLDEDDDVYCVWRGEFDEETNICSYGMDLFQRRGEFWERSFEEHQEYAYSEATLRGFLKDAGFTRIEVFADRKLERPGPGEQRIYFKARKGTIR